MTSPPVAEAAQEEPLSISVPEFGSIRDCINWLVAWAQLHGSDIGYRQMSRMYHREKLRDAERTDTELGLDDVHAGEGRLGQDRTFGSDPTGETAVRRVMDSLLRIKK